MAVYEKWTEMAQSEVSIFEMNDMLISYSRLPGCTVFVVGKNTCNELILDMIQENIFAVLDIILDGGISKESIEKQIERVYCMLDEMLEQGFIMEETPEVVAARVLLEDDNKFISGR
jgi:hypothetical protein